MSEQDIPTADELRRRREELGFNTVQAAGTVRCGFWAGLIEACEDPTRLPTTRVGGAAPYEWAQQKTYGELRQLYAERLTEIEEQTALAIRMEVEQQVAIRGEAREVLAELRRSGSTYPGTLRAKRFVQEHLYDLRCAYLRGEATSSDIMSAIEGLSSGKAQS